jgi:hypothetical protein
MVVAVLFVVVGLVNQPDHNQQCCYHHAPTVKPEAANAVLPPDDGHGGTQNMLSHT